MATTSTGRISVLLGCLIIVLIGARFAYTQDSDKLELKLSLPDETWTSPVGARIPIAGSLGTRGIAHRPDELLFTVEQVSRGETVSLGRTLLRLDPEQSDSIRILDVIQIERPPVPDGSASILACYARKDGHALGAQPLLKKRLRIDEKMRIHWPANKMNPERKHSQARGVAPPVEASGEIEFGTPVENMRFLVMTGGSFYMFGRVMWKPQSAGPPSVVFLMFSRVQGTASERMLMCKIGDVDQRDTDGFPVAGIGEVLPLPMEYLGDQVHVRAVFLGKECQKIGQTDLIGVGIARPKER